MALICCRWLKPITKEGKHLMKAKISIMNCELLSGRWDKLYKLFASPHRRQAYRWTEKDWNVFFLTTMHRFDDQVRRHTHTKTQTHMRVSDLQMYCKDLTTRQYRNNARRHSPQRRNVMQPWFTVTVWLSCYMLTIALLGYQRSWVQWRLKSPAIVYSTVHSGADQRNIKALRH